MIPELGQLPEIAWPSAPSPEKEAAGDKRGDCPKPDRRSEVQPAKRGPRAQSLSYTSPAAPRSRAEDINNSKTLKKNTYKESDKQKS